MIYDIVRATRRQMADLVKTGNDLAGVVLVRLDAADDADEELRRINSEVSEVLWAGVRACLAATPLFQADSPTSPVSDQER